MLGEAGFPPEQTETTTGSISVVGRGHGGRTQISHKHRRTL